MTQGGSRGWGVRCAGRDEQDPRVTGGAVKGFAAGPRAGKAGAAAEERQGHVCVCPARRFRRTQLPFGLALLLFVKPWQKQTVIEM